jgi:transcription antitermination protein NusB
MSLPKQKFREVVLQLLYSYDFKCLDKEGLLSLIMKENKISKTNALNCFVMVEQIVKQKELIDASITDTCPDYSFERISSVEKNILRLSLYEILFDKTLPEKISIAEGIRLAKKYGTPQSAKFVNAILDAIYKKGCNLALEISG